MSMSNDDLSVIYLSISLLIAIFCRNKDRALNTMFNAVYEHK